MNITLYTCNILETGTLTVTGDADTGFPETRLYDRSISLYWKDTITEAKNFVIDQGAADNLSIDFLAINRHNFSGKDMQWQYSNDNFVTDINDAVTDWTQAGNDQITKTLSSTITSRYWRITVSNILDPKCGEIYMSCGKEFKIAGDPSPIIENLDNVRWNRTVGGVERSTKFGDNRKVREYTLLLDSTDLIQFRSTLNDYSKPFYIKDHDDNYWMCRLKEIPVEEPNTVNNLTMTTLYLIEML